MTTLYLEQARLETTTTETLRGATGSGGAEETAARGDRSVAGGATRETAGEQTGAWVDCFVLRFIAGCRQFNTCSEGSKGGIRDAPPLGPIPFIFMPFWWEN